MTTLIPTGNPKALAAYYLGVFSLIPGLALILGPLALIFGILGKRYANANPKAKGWGHALAGIVLGSLTTFAHVVLIVIIAIAIWSQARQGKSENTEAQDRIAEIVKRSKGGPPIEQPPVQPFGPKGMEVKAGKQADLPPERLFSANRNLLHPDQIFPVKEEDGLVATVRVGALQVTRVVFAPDGKTVAVSTSDGHLLIESATSRTRTIPAEVLAFSRDSKSLAAIQRQPGINLLFLYNVATGEPSRMLTPSSKCDAAQFSTDGRYFVAALLDPAMMDLGAPKGNKIMRWSCNAWDNEPITLLGPSKTNFPALAFAPDGSTMAIAATESKKGLGVCLVNPENGKIMTWLHSQDKRQSLSSIAFSPDSKLLASAGSDSRIVIWDLPVGKPRKNLTGHKQGLGGVVFSPQGDFLASRGFDGTVRLWDAKTWNELAVRGNEEATTTEALAFTPDGKLLITGSHGLLKAWDVAKLTRR
jgi:Tol biopolymer transport system component